MKYFRNLSSQESVKAEYRKLAMANHPDRGGSDAAMTEINSEFRIALAMAPGKDDGQGAPEYVREFYTQNGWAGSRVYMGLSAKEVAKQMRDYVKNVYPVYKFSITYQSFSGGASVSVALLETPVDITSIRFMSDYVRDNYSECMDMYRRCRGVSADSDGKLSFEDTVRVLAGDIISRQEFTSGMSGFMAPASGSDWMNPSVRAALEDVSAMLKSFRYDDSDPQTDYFSTNFYTHETIGQCCRPCVTVQRTMRIVSARRTKAKGISA